MVLMLVGGVSTNCAWLKRVRRSPRQHWWEFWKPKQPSGDFIYPEDPTPPPPPPTLDSGLDTGINPLPVEEPTGPGTELEGPFPGTSIPETPISRQPVQGMINDLQTVHFDFDSSALTPEARRMLDQNAEFLLNHPEIKVLVEGHCDERGTEEYNLNLGQRRADAVREYLAAKGVPPRQLETLTFGESRPVDPGHDESAWSKNRRAQFMIY
jgi:peptidoglycan-associated lipoprotein